MKTIGIYKDIERYYYDPKINEIFKGTISFKDAGRNLYYVRQKIEKADREDNAMDLDGSLLSFDSSNIGEMTGDYLIRIRPSIKKLDQIIQRDGSRYGEILNAFEYKIRKMLEPDAMRERALKIGGNTLKQYLYWRIAKSGEELANTRPFVGSCYIDEDKQLKNLQEVSDRIFAERYAESEVQEVDDRIRTSRKYKTLRNWREKVYAMERTVLAESEAYKQGKGKGKKIEEYAMGAIVGNNSTLNRDGSRNQPSTSRPRRSDSRRYKANKIKKEILEKLARTARYVVSGEEIGPDIVYHYGAENKENEETRE